MRDKTEVSSDQVKAKQQRNLIIGVGIIIFILGVLYWLMSNDSSPTMKEQSQTESISLVHPTNQIDAQSVWMERAQKQLKEEQQKTTELEQKVAQLKAGENQKPMESTPEYQALQQQVQALQKSQESLETKNQSKQLLSGGNAYSGQVFSTTPGAVASSNSDVSSLSQSTGIDNDELNLKPAAGSVRPKRNPDTFVPAGSFAEAIMLGAADASAGVSSQANPSPMLFRIIASGTLPNHQKSHLKDCVVTAAVVGDISSERGEIRLERMSCTFPNGEIVEQPVEGTVFGMDAKNGVRGNPLWREGALLTRAAIAGTLSGFANGVSQTYTSNSISPLGNTQTVDNGAVFKYGVASGASNAMEKLADYNIRRAEQYHPVIQISAGQPVDVVFLKGFYLDGKKHDESEQESHAQPELFPNRTSTPPSSSTGLTLSEQQLEKIKQHENSMGWVRSENSGEIQ